MATHLCTSCPLKSPAARNLTDEELGILEKNSALVHFKKGEIIFREDALSTNVAYLRTGIAKIHKRGPAADKILRVVKAPTYLGIPTSMGEKINQFSATALVETSVCFIDTNLFRNFIFQNGAFAYEIIMELCRHELNDYQRFTSQSQKQVPGIVAETLLCFSEKIFANTRFQFPLTRGEIGDLVGTSRESVSRVLTDLAGEGIITYDAREITILDPERLKQISDKG